MMMVVLCIFGGASRDGTGPRTNEIAELSDRRSKQRTPPGGAAGARYAGKHTDSTTNSRQS